MENLTTTPSFEILETGKSLPKLSQKNLLAAQSIYELLKEQKTVSREAFVREFYYNRPELPSYTTYPYNSYPYNYQNVLLFLLYKGLMTSHLINGLRIYVATKKTVFSQSFENAIK